MNFLILTNRHLQLSLHHGFLRNIMLLYKMRKKRKGIGHSLRQGWKSYWKKTKVWNNKFRTFRGIFHTTTAQLPEADFDAFEELQAKNRKQAKLLTSSDEDDPDEPEEKKTKKSPQWDWDQQSDPDCDISEASITDDELIGSSQPITNKAITKNTGVHFMAQDQINKQDTRIIMAGKFTLIVWPT